MTLYVAVFVYSILQSLASDKVDTDKVKFGIVLKVLIYLGFAVLRGCSVLLIIYIVSLLGFIVI